jgi:hypothetical protein
MNSTRRKISPVLDIARGLGMPLSADPIAYLIAHCRRLVDRWVGDYGPRSLRELLDTATAKIGVIIEEVHEDWDLQEINQRYLTQGEGGFARIGSDLDQRTFALAIRLRRHRNGCSHVAVIDCRGSKYARRWFSIWHEIVHLMLNPQLELDFRRTTAESKDPVEAMIDKIAGELAFYPPMYGSPLLSSSRPSLADLETHRKLRSPEASREAAYATAVSRISRPALFLVAGLALKASEQRALDSRRFPAVLPTPQLRVLRTAGSENAKAAGLFVPHHYRVPPSSIIYRLFHEEIDTSPDGICREVENLDQWKDSTGRSLPNVPVVVEAIRNGIQVVFAIVTTIEPQ